MNVMCDFSELLEAPMLPDELEAVRKAKMLYLSCMNESESNTYQKKGVKKTKQKKTAHKKNS